MPFTPYQDQSKYKETSQFSMIKRQQEKESLVQKLGDFLGIKKFGEAIGDTAYLYGTKEGRDLQKKAQQGDKGAIAGLSAVTESAPTNKEIIGSAASTAANILSGGIAKPIGLLGRTVEGAALGYGYDVGSKLQENKPVSKALTPGLTTAVGTVLPGAGKLVSKGIGLAGNATKHIASYLSGVPSEAIDTALKNPTKISEAINRLVKNDEEKIQIVNKARKSLQSMVEKRNQAYAESLKGIEKSAGTENLSLGGLKQKVVDTLGNFKLLQNGKLNFTRSQFPTAQNNQLKEVLTRISKWKDTTPTGLNDLRQIIGGYYKGSAETKGFDKIITTLKNNLGDYLSENVPAISQMNQTYAKDSQIIEQMMSELSLKNGKSPTMALNKLTSIFNRNSEFKKKLVKRLGEEGGQQMMDDIVASMFTEWFPRGLSSRILSGAGGLVIGAASNAPGAAVGAVMASPRLLGKAVTKLGKFTQALQKTGKKLVTDLTEEDIKSAIKNIRPGLTIQDVSKKSPLIQEARKYKSAEDAGRAFKEMTGDSAEIAGVKMAGAEIRKEAFPYTVEQMKVYDSYQNLKYPSSKYLYHTTPTENLASISKEGLVTGKKPRFEGVSSSKKVSLSASEEAAKYYGGSNDALIRVNKKYAKTIPDLEGDYLAGGSGVYTTGKNIPPEMLEVKINGKWQPLKSQPLQEGEPLIQEARKGIEKSTVKEGVENMRDYVYPGVKKMITDLESKVKNAPNPDAMVKIEKKLDIAKGILKSLEKNTEPMKDMQELAQRLKLNGFLK